MATIGEFGSLLQLGFGIGAGLSLFRSPLDLRVKSISSAINDEIKLAELVRSDIAKERLGNLHTIKLRFEEIKIKAESKQYPFFYATVVGAALNLGALIIASLNAGYQLGLFQEIYLVYISVIHYLTIAAKLEITARRNFSRLKRDLDEIRG